MNEKMKRDQAEAIEAELSEFLSRFPVQPQKILPSPAVIESIHHAAREQIAHKANFWKRLRVASLAASLLLLLGGIGSFAIYQHHSEAALGTSFLDEETLLGLQGLDAETCFSVENEILETATSML